MDKPVTHLPSRPGTYVLVASLRQGQTIQVGQLARIEFNPGVYMYVGSARGPGGLSARLGRHLRRIRKQHWHIDYLLPYLHVEAVWMHIGRQPMEHRWAKAVEREAGEEGAVKGFGCSDCACFAHLFHFDTMLSARNMETILEQAFCWVPGEP